eukprot:scaffold1_cov375-Pavlova_lutheri.AAC.52
MEGINTFEKIAKQGYTVKAIRSDLGGEFQSSQLQNFMKDRGITHETTARYTPQQNAAKRLHRTLHDSARAMLIRAKLPESLWGEAMRCAKYVRNRTPVSFLADDRTPLEILTGSTPNLHRLRTFGCDAWVLIPPEKRKNKFSARSVVGMSPLLKTNSAVNQSMKNNLWTALKSYEICFLNLRTSVERPSAVWTSFQYLRIVEVRLLDREEPSTRMAQILKTPPLVPSTAQPGQVLRVQLLLQLPINHLLKQMEVLRKPLQCLEKLPPHFLQV